MARPRIPLGRRIKDVLGHVQPLPAEARAPLLHYHRTSTDAWNSLTYVAKSFELAGCHKPTARRHLGRLTRWCSSA